MPVDFKKKIIFFHITKCGGSTIEKRYEIDKAINFCSGNWNEYTYEGVRFAPQHLTPKALFHFAPKTYDFDSFCIIRHPYERLVSDYFFTTRDMPRRLRRVYRKFHNPEHLFKESRFRFWLKTEASRKNRDHYLDQWEYAKYASNVYRLHEMGKWISEVDAKLGLTHNTPIRSVNVGGNKTSEIVGNLSSESKELIRKIYSRDFDHLPFSE